MFNQDYQKILVTLFMTSVFSVGSAYGVLTYDFTSHPDDVYFVQGGYTNATLNAKQVEAKADGLHIYFDGDKTSFDPPWCTLVIKKDSPVDDSSTQLPFKSIDWTGSKLQLTFKAKPFKRCTKGMALNFTDNDGETFQYLPNELVEDNGDGWIRANYEIFPDKFRGVWGGGKNANRTVDGPMRFVHLNIHFTNPYGKGEVVFGKLSEIQNVIPTSRTIRSVEAISTDTTYPGAKPFSGAKSLTFKCDKSYSGKALLLLSHGSQGSVQQGKITYHSGTFKQATVTFDLNLPYDTLYQFVALRDDNGKNIPVLSAKGEFYQTADEALRFEIETGHPTLGICREEISTERPTVILSNPTDQALSFNTVIRFWDALDHNFTIPFNRTLKPQEKVRIAIPWPLPAKGVWYAEVVLPDNIKKRTQFAWIDYHQRTPKLCKPAFRMGIHWHSTHYLPDWVDPVIEAMVAAGAKFTRMDYGCTFSYIAKPDGTYDWHLSDDMIGRLEKAGLAMEVIVGGTPAWAVEPSVYEARKNTTHGWCLPSREGLFEAFAQAIGKRYGTRIDYYEIGNEWDLVPNTTLSFDEALRMQREAYVGLHKGCPNVCVTPNGWASSATGKWMVDQKEKYNPGLIELFAKHRELYDAWAFHNHGSFGAYENAFQNQFLPLQQTTPLKTVSWIAGETAFTNYGNGEKAVARTVWAKILYAWSWGAQDYIWYNLRATGWLPGSEPGYGLMTAGLKPRASYAAYSALTSVFSGLSADKCLISQGHQQVLSFKGSKADFTGYVVAGWDFNQEDEEKVIRLKTDAKHITFVDMMGNRKEATCEDGIVNLPIGINPKAVLLHNATWIMMNEE